MENQRQFILKNVEACRCFPKTILFCFNACNVSLENCFTLDLNKYCTKFARVFVSVKIRKLEVWRAISDERFISAYKRLKRVRKTYA